MSATILTALIARCRALSRPRSSAEDAELLRRFTQGCNAAFEELLERHAPLVWSVCRRILPRESDAEDAFQATFLALVQRPDAVDPRQALGAWLHTIAVRVARKVLLRARRESPQAILPEPTTRGDVADEVGSRELLRLVDQEIERLPALLRQPLILCCLQGRTRDEAATALGCSVAAVKGRLERGRDLLRRRLERRGVQLPVAFLVVGLTAERVRAVLWAKTMQAVLYTPTPAIVALAEAGASALTFGKGKLLLAMVLLATTTVGAVGSLLTTTQTPEPPSATPTERATAEQPKKPQPPQPRTDRYGDPLPEGAIARLGTVRWRHGDLVRALAYSPDGKKIVTTGVGRALVLWDAATGKELRAFPNRGQPHGVAYSPDGKSIATTQRAGQLWDVATGKLLRELKSVQSAVEAVAFAPDGKTLATAHNDGTLRLWDPASGEEKRRIDCGQGGVNKVAYSPDGATLASGSNDGAIRLWEADTGKERRHFAVGKKEIFSIVFSPDGATLAVGTSDEAARVWDVESGRQLRAFGDKQGLFAPLTFSPDGKLLAIGYPDGSLSLWDAASGEEKRHWSAGWGLAIALAFSPDGKTLASAVLWDGGIRLWDVASGRERHTSDGHRGPIPLLRFAADKRTLISAGLDKNVLWWDVATQTPRRRFTWTTDSFTAFALSPDGDTLAVADRKTHEVWLWDVPKAKTTRLIGKHADRIQSVAFSPDGRFVASGGNDKAIHVWDVREGKEVWQIKGTSNSLGRLLFSPDGKTLASGAPLRLRNAVDGKERSNFGNQAGEDYPLAFSPDGKVLVSANDVLGKRVELLIRLWDTKTGKELCRHTGHLTSIGATEFSPDGKLVASGGGSNEDNAVHIWEAATGRLIRRFEGHHSWLFAITFAADGLTLASSAGDSTILLWDITGRRPDGHWHPTPLTPQQLEACWTALANQDAAKAYDAVWALAAAPEQAVPFLRKHLPPIARPDDKAIARWIADLDSEDFSVRQRATDELSKLDDAIAPAVRQAMADKPTLEMRRRLQQLLEQTRDWTPERLRVHRAIQALEHMNTRSARAVLQALAEGAAETQRTEEAKAALRRCERETKPVGESMQVKPGKCRDVGALDLKPLDE